MQTTLKLFSRTFNKVPQIQPILQKLKSSITTKNHPYYLHQTARLYFISQQLISQISQLQNQESVEVIDSINKKFQDFYYDYENSRFVMSRRDPLNNSLVSCKVDSLNIEKLDHPSIRKSLYFHELKDMYKYTTIKNTYGFPKFWQDIQLEAMQDRQLDAKNPLGIPLHSKPLKINVQCSKEKTLCGFDLIVHLGAISLKEAYNYQGGTRFNVDCRLLEEETQKTVFEFIRTKTTLQPEEYNTLKKLAFIGGRIKNTEFVFDYLDEIADCFDQESKYHKMIEDTHSEEQYEKIVGYDGEDEEELINEDDWRDLGFKQLKLKTKKPANNKK